MKTKIHVKKGDLVVLLSGKNRTKKGKVLSVSPGSNQVIVEGINMATKHKKPKKAGQPSGIIKQEAPVHSSNVMLICPECSNPTKVGKETLENGDKYRKCKKCGATIDKIHSKD